MNLEKLFEMQKELDQAIVEKHGLQGQDLLLKKILALQVELGELANEWRGFKFWSEDQEPRTEDEIFCIDCYGTGGSLTTDDFLYQTGVREEICEACNGRGYKTINPLLEEYVDCLHFFLSIGNELDVNKNMNFETERVKTNDTLELFELIILNLAKFWLNDNTVEWVIGFLRFLKLGEKLGFTWDEIEQAYLAKNKVNHQRQANGY